MSKKNLLLICCLFIFDSLFAQLNEIKGTIIDSSNIRPVVYASISILNKSDSVLIIHTRTNQQGKFSVSNLQKGKYIMLAAHNAYADYIDDITLNENEKFDVGTIQLLQRGLLLKEVVIKNMAGIKIKGDTLEYLADSFKVKQGAMVEDLLKKLPGLQVNKNGEITAMGEKVEKILVDGEEFFGDDPTVATQNIQSKVVDKVQVFDKKSDQAKLTGFADGQEQKTINLKLKDGMNKGEFGKVELKAGPEDRWQAQAMINSFKNKRQMSAYGMMSSLGKTGLGWEDSKNFATGDNVQMEDDRFVWTSDAESDNNYGIKEGITKAYTGGARYANKWLDGKQNLNANYSYGDINTTKKETSITENLYPNNKYKTLDTTHSFSNRKTHRITTRYEYVIDTNTNIVYNLSSRLAFNESNTSSNTFNQTYAKDAISNSIRTNDNQSKTMSINNQITLNRKLKKIGRTISLTASDNYSNNMGTGYLEGENDFDLLANPQTQLLDQQKIQSQTTNSFYGNITYTEPLAKKILLKTLYSYNSDVNNSIKNTNIKNGNEDYTERIDSLSSQFNSIVNSHTVGGEIKYTEKKYNITIGSKVKYSSFHQEDIVRKYKYDYNRINVFPNIRFSYKKNQYKRFSVNYSGSTRQPSISQIQPVQDNSNPLIVYIGNPNLKIGYSQTISGNYNVYKVLSSRNIYTGFTLGNNYNSISINRSFDNYGRTVNQYVNLKTSYSASMYGGYNAPIPKTKIQGGVNVNASYNFTPNIINNIDGFTNNYSLRVTPSLSYSKENKFSSSIDFGTSYSYSDSRITSTRKISYVTFNPSAEIEYYFTKHIEFGSDIDFYYYPAVGPYTTTFTRFLWNSYISYKMLKKKNFEWRLSMNDILNQNKGYDRTTANNYNTERHYLTLGRYTLFGFIWNFNTGPMSNTAPQGPPPRGQRPMGGGMRRPN